MVGRFQAIAAVAAAACVSALMAAPATAALLASDDFTVPTAPVSLRGATTGTGWASGGWVTQNNVTQGYEIRDTAPLTYGTLYNSPSYGVGGYQYVTNSRTLDVSATSAFAQNNYVTGGLVGTDGKSLWVSYLIRQHTNDFGSTHFYFDLLNSSTNVVRVAADSGDWVLQLGTGARTTTGVPVTLDQTHLIVLKLDFGAGAGGADMVSLFIDPTLGTTPTNGLTLTATQDISFKSIRYMVGTGSGYASTPLPNLGGGTPNGAVDAIRFGQTYADVTPTSAAVPEPASLALFGLGGLLLASRRRKPAHS